MRRPGIAGCEDEGLRSIDDVRAFARATARGAGNAGDRLRRHDVLAVGARDEPANECLIVERHTLRREQLLEGEVGRIASAGRTDFAGVAPQALRTSAV